MPFSSPSYFINQRSNASVIGATSNQGQIGARCFFAGANAGGNFGQVENVADLVLIGDSVCATNGVTDANAQNSVMIGSQTGKNAKFFTTANVGIQSGPAVLIGGGNFPGLLTFANTVSVGANIFQGITETNQGHAGADGVGGNVFVGTNIGNLANIFAQIQRTVLIGSESLQGVNGTSLITVANVLIGQQVCASSPGGGNFVGNVVLGFDAAPQYSGFSSVIIGSQATPNLQANASGPHAVIIGANANCNSNIDRSVIIGNAASSSGTGGITIGANAGTTSASGNFNILIGDAFNGGMGPTGARNIWLGASAGNTVSAALNDIFIVATFDGTTQRGILYGDMNAGNLVVGNSVAANRVTVGTNTLKLVNGTAGGAAAGGGYFYCIGANSDLHYVRASGDDTLLSWANGQLAANAQAGGYTNNAGAQAATITNGPTAGNPTKWIPINDNGTIRNIPAW